MIGTDTIIGNRIIFTKGYYVHKCFGKNVKILILTNARKKLKNQFSQNLMCDFSQKTKTTENVLLGS